MMERHVETDALVDTGATRLYMAGIATNYVVEHGARHASDLGYDVAVVGDACSTAKPHLHAASLETLSIIVYLGPIARV